MQLSTLGLPPRILPSTAYLPRRVGFEGADLGRGSVARWLRHWTVARVPFLLAAEVYGFLLYINVHFSLS